MVDSLLINRQLVERCLARLRLFDKMCSDEELKTIANVVEFLKIFKIATQVLSGNSKYYKPCFAIQSRNSSRPPRSAD